MVFGFGIVALHKFDQNETSLRIFYCMFSLLNLFYFIFPCMCAAYVTNACGGEYCFAFALNNKLTQLVITCSKLTIETVEQGVIYVSS